ncbi:hypothetical protein Q5H93_06315 [Hymenobacter sp. ASUV-10]|uniref:Uncharacterized protein n=1 Tax=Hymenobacter aranciens TaxID=3063996 RepID=A0ABT9B7Y7_9BACT|nr:hypothetical protein [Hymenobacter sp. ASUV-10]MDO7874340.1 hypothetical protein [Hymenobacter sp. ASUV-10]
MAKKIAAAQVEATEVANDTTTEQVVDAAAETTTEETTEEATTEKAKRERNYSQTAIDKADLERLNAFKENIKTTRNLNVSNQTILSAALDCLAENMEPFLKKLVADANTKQRQKDLKAFEALKAKLALADDATETEAKPEAEATEAAE